MVFKEIPSSSPLVLILAVITLAISRGVLAVDYTVSVRNDAASTNGGPIFASQIGEDYSRQTLASATDYSDDVKTGFTGILYHEMTHVWQWLGDGQAKYRWDQDDSVTVRFLDYCESLMGGFVAQLNMMMEYGYSDSFFLDLLGKSVDQLWSEYKAMYGS